MPTVLIKSNVKMDEGVKTTLMQDVTEVMTEATGKPKSFVLVSVEECTMMFGGSSEPCAYIFVASLGAIGGSVNVDLSKALSGLLEKHANVAANRLYVQFCDVKNRNDFGWNGTTFG